MYTTAELFGIVCIPGRCAGVLAGEHRRVTGGAFVPVVVCPYIHCDMLLLLILPGKVRVHLILLFDKVNFSHCHHHLYRYVSCGQHKAQGVQRQPREARFQGTAHVQHDATRYILRTVRAQLLVCGYYTVPGTTAALRSVPEKDRVIVVVFGRIALIMSSPRATVKTGRKQRRFFCGETGTWCLWY